VLQGVGVGYVAVRNTGGWWLRHTWAGGGFHLQHWEGGWITGCIV